jgi:ribosomal protein S27E
VKPFVFRTQDGRFYLVRCPRCLRENPLPAVATGTCTWCGYVAEEGDVK